MNSYSDKEIAYIQDRWNFRFPPDLCELLRRRRPLLAGAFDWISSSDKIIEQIIAWPFEGIMFDVEHNNLWWPEWGDKPLLVSEQREILKDVINKAAKLIPLAGHRYLPETPFESGNPVFSVYQADVVYYGSDLSEWLAWEEHGAAIGLSKSPKEIEFWSEMERRNG